jgi:hypothetical protein
MSKVGTERGTVFNPTSIAFVSSSVSELGFNVSSRRAQGENAGLGHQQRL